MRTHRGSFPALCSALHHVPSITLGIRLLWPLLTSAQSLYELPHKALLSGILSTSSYLLTYFARLQVEADLKTPGLGQPVAPSGIFTR